MTIPAQPQSSTDQPQPTLEQSLMELHLQLGQQLQSGLSGSDAEQVLLGVGAAYARLLEQHVSVPQYNTPGENVRPRMVDVHVRLAKLLGRNSPEAVRADTRSRLQTLGEKILFRPGMGNKQKVNPSYHIQTVVVPQLDEDMIPHAYNQSIYNFPLMKSFHTLIGMWRNRGEDLGLIQSSK